MPRLESIDLHPSAAGVSLFRGNTKDEPVGFCAAMGTRRGVMALVAACNACGFLTATKNDDCYGVLDILDSQGDIVQDYGLTHSGWKYVYRKVGVLRRQVDA